MPDPDGREEHDSDRDDHDVDGEQQPHGLKLPPAADGETEVLYAPARA